MRRFEFRDDKSAKFWTVDVKGSTLKVSWGRIGSTRQSKQKQFDDQAQAVTEAEKQLAKKLKKGYVEVDPYRPLAVTPLSGPDKHHGLVLGLAVDGKRVVAVGGQGYDLLLVSATGRAFSTRKSPGPGLRSAYLQGDELWVCGEYGYVAKSLDRGKTWTKVTSRATRCLFGIVADDHGNLWTAGIGGFIGVCRDRKTFRKVSGAEEYIERISNSPLGILIPTNTPGYLYICNGKSVERTALKAGVDLMNAIVTQDRTLIVVGVAGHVYRSTDRGRTFKRIKVPTSANLIGIDCLADGRIIVVGGRSHLFGNRDEKGVILVSSDDGLRFKTVKNTAFDGMLWCCKAHRDGMVVGGARGTVLRIGEA